MYIRGARHLLVGIGRLEKGSLKWVGDKIRIIKKQREKKRRTRKTSKEKKRRGTMYSIGEKPQSHRLDRQTSYHA